MMTEDERADGRTAATQADPASANTSPANTSPTNTWSGSATVGASTSPDDAGAQPAEPDPFKVLEALQAENAALKDRSLRALADAENARRRAERDVADAKAYGVSSFARDMLTVADNLNRALESLPADVKSSAQGPVKSFIDGIELTERDFLTTLGRFGVTKIEPLGQKFDPNLHQAMFEIPDESVPNGTVKQVMQSGFTIQGRVLRPAMVGISKNGSKAASGPQTAEANGAA